MDERGSSEREAFRSRCPERIADGETRRESPILNTREAIATRRSIRRFKDEPIPDEVLTAVLLAGTQAPSGKNRQPWRFHVVKRDKREEMMRIMRQGIENTKARGFDIGSAEWTALVMEHAPVTIFVFNPHGLRPWDEHSTQQHFMDVVNVQSVGAAIQNMCLAALDLGLGSLWICDVFEAYEELSDWLGEECQMVAALSLGYPDESPGARPRKPVDEVTHWVYLAQAGWRRERCAYRYAGWCTRMRLG